MKKTQKLKHLLIFLAILGISVLGIEFFDIPNYIVFSFLAVLAYFRHEDMLDKMSMDLHMVEALLSEKFPDDFSEHDEFSRDF